MRVDLAITGLYVGGAEKNFVRLARGLVHDHGDEVRVLSLQPFPTTSERMVLFEELRQSGIDVRSANLSGIGSLPSACRFIRHWCESGQAEVCQTFLHHANWLVPGPALASGTRVLVGGMRVAEDRWLRNWLEGRSLRKCNAIVAVSSAVSRFTEQSLSIPAGQIETIHNSIELPQEIATQGSKSEDAVWNPETIGWPSDARFSLFVGRMHPQKAIDDLLESAESWLSRAGHRLLLVGDGPLEEKVDRQIERLNQSWQQNLIHRLPWQSDVMSLMRRCELVVLPSRYEGMPNVIMEAMSLGLPVLSSDVEGSLELLGHDNQQVFSAGSIRELSAKWQALLERADLRDELGSRNRRTIAENFTVEKMVSKYRELYQRLLDRDDQLP